MLEGRGIDYESIGIAWGMRDAFNNLEREASRQILEGNRNAAQHEAHAAGRHAQMQALLRALRDVDPDHSALQQTGLYWPCGTPALQYELGYEAAYDDVARSRGITLSTSPMTPSNRAAAQVLSEPIRESRLFFCRRWHWRGDEYRSREGAERARRRAADQVRREVA